MKKSIRVPHRMINPLRNTLLLGLILAPFNVCYAHIRWFVDVTGVGNVSFPVDGLMALTLVGAVCFIIFCLYLENISLKTGWLHTALKRPLTLPYHAEWYLLLAVLNLFLGLNLMMGIFLAPNLVLPPHLIMVGIVIQMAVLILLPVSVALVGVALIVVAFFSLLLFPFATAIDYFFELLAVGIAYLLMAPHLCRLDFSLSQKLKINITASKAWAVTALTIGLGLQLATLAIHNKFMVLGIALRFMEAFPHYNFMQVLGFEAYTHLHFIFAAGVFEMVFGLLLCFGIATRLIGIMLAFIFTATAILAGISEIIGHLPLFAVVAIIILHGAPQLKNRP